MKTLQQKNVTIILGVLIAVLAALTFAGYGTVAAHAEPLPAYTYEADGRTFESADSAEDAFNNNPTGRKQMTNL